MNKRATKTWFITGATRGFGNEIAKSAINTGENVVLTGRNISKLKSLFENSNQVLCLELDVCNEQQIKSAVQDAVEYFGRIDVLVNNAGFGQLGVFEEVESQKIHDQFSTNVFGAMSVTRHVLPIMREQRSGLIYNISSIGGSLGFENASIYCAAKFALEGFSESIAMEIKQFGIDVTIVQPGFFRTDFLDNSSVQYGTLKIDDYYEYAKGLNDGYKAQNHKQLGDPSKLGKLLIDIANKSNPPMRLAAGSDAIQFLTASNKERQSVLEKWREYSNQTDI